MRLKNNRTEVSRDTGRFIVERDMVDVLSCGSSLRWEQGVGTGLGGGRRHREALRPRAGCPWLKRGPALRNVLPFNGTRGIRAQSGSCSLHKCTIFQGEQRDSSNGAQRCTLGAHTVHTFGTPPFKIGKFKGGRDHGARYPPKKDILYSYFLRWVPCTVAEAALEIPYFERGRPKSVHRVCTECAPLCTVAGRGRPEALTNVLFYKGTRGCAPSVLNLVAHSLPKTYY